MNTVMHSPSMRSKLSENAELVMEVERRLGRPVAVGEWAEA